MLSKLSVHRSRRGEFGCGKLGNLKTSPLCRSIEPQICSVWLQGVGQEEKGHRTLEFVDNVLICGFVLQENTWQITNKISCKDLEDPCPGELLYERRVLIWFDENQPISILGVQQLEGPGFQQ